MRDGDESQALTGDATTYGAAHAVLHACGANSPMSRPSRTAGRMRPQSIDSGAGVQAQQRHAGAAEGDAAQRQADRVAQAQPQHVHQSDRGNRSAATDPARSAASTCSQPKQQPMPRGFRTRRCLTTALVVATTVFYLVELVTLHFRMFNGPIGLGPPLAGLAKVMLIVQMAVNIALLVAVLASLAYGFHSKAIAACRTPVRVLRAWCSPVYPHRASHPLAAERARVRLYRRVSLA